MENTCFMKDEVLFLFTGALKVPLILHLTHPGRGLNGIPVEIHSER